MKQSRSGTDLSNLQELLDASEASPEATLRKGQAQYFTPSWLAEACGRIVGVHRPDLVIDPQGGDGRLVRAVFSAKVKLTVELDNRIEHGWDMTNRLSPFLNIRGSCLKFAEILTELYPDARSSCIVANPPFGHRWSGMDSSEWTHLFIKERLAPYGLAYMITNASTAERLGLINDNMVFAALWLKEGTFDANFQPVVLFYHAGPIRERLVEPERTYDERSLRDFAHNAIGWLNRCIPTWGRSRAYSNMANHIKDLSEIMAEEMQTHRYNVWLTETGRLSTYLSTRKRLLRKLTKEDLGRLARIKGQTPLSLTAEKETRQLLAALVSDEFYEVQPAARAAIDDALSQVRQLATPIMPVTDFERVAYTDEEETLRARVSCRWPKLKAGRVYPIETATYEFKEEFKELHVHFDEKEQRTYTKEHECQLTGQDRYIQITDDDGQMHRFMDRPDSKQPWQHDDTRLWELFEKPHVTSIADVQKDAVLANLHTLDVCEIFGNFRYYDGQRQFYSVVAVKDQSLVGAETGCHRKGAGILMYSGKVKNVEDIVPGDVIQGWDGTPRKVLELKRGREQMVEIIPVKGDPFVVNKSHILTLVQTNTSPCRSLSKTNGVIRDVSVFDYLGWNREWKHLHKLFRVPMRHWSTSRQPFPSRMIGLLLGDGLLKYDQPNVTIPDIEIHTYIREVAEKYGWRIRFKDDGTRCPTLYLAEASGLRQHLIELGLWGHTAEGKFIPELYKIANERQRLELLAGLIDSDGHLSCNGYEVISKSPKLADDIAFVARSLGFAATISDKWVRAPGHTQKQLYRRVFISGNVDRIPCLIYRKKALPRRQIKDWRRTGFQVRELEEEDYYGFTIEGDGRYVMSDFTVTHNTGKTLGAISLISMKGPQRALIVAPGSTMRSSEGEGSDFMEASQWVQELRRFAPGLQVFELFSYEDYLRLLNLNDGELPNGVFISYYEAMFRNGAQESLPGTWDDRKWCARWGLKVREEVVQTENGRVLNPILDYYTGGIGEERKGIRCISEPCLSTLAGHHFDMVILDEAHAGCNLEATVTQMILRLQPRYRYALTATPIPNIVTNLFSLMGWLCVPGWYRGGECNAAWPWAREHVGNFERLFLSTKRDFTAEDMKKKFDPTWKGKCTKVSPIISAPARLLKILRPTLAFISKEQCNPNLPPCTVHDVRVPMTAEQAKLYGHFMKLENVPYHGKDARRRKALQIAILRAMTAEPATCKWNLGRVKTNFTPKTVAVLEIADECLRRGEQVVIVSARTHQSDQFERRLRDAGVTVARIDSTINPEQHTFQANLFKAGKARVMLMGIKCAQGHSFDKCPNLIIGSLEYSYGSLNQAIGRVYRVTTRQPVNIWCVLHKDTIEEIMYDTVATKGDAATICLRGQRVPRSFRPVTLDEVLARNLVEFSAGRHPSSELEMEQQWPKLLGSLKQAALISAA